MGWMDSEGLVHATRTKGIKVKEKTTKQKSKGKKPLREESSERKQREAAQLSKESISRVRNRRV